MKRSLVGIITVLIFSALTSCYPWEGKVFYSLKTNRVEKSKTYRLTWDGTTCKEVRKDQTGMKVDTDSEILSRKNCAPFIIAERLNAKFNGCKPRVEELNIDETDIAQWSRDTLILDASCFCYSFHQEQYLMKIFEEKRFGTINQCKNLFPSNQAKEAQKIIEEVLNEVTSS